MNALFTPVEFSLSQNPARIPCVLCRTGQYANERGDGPAMPGMLFRSARRDGGVTGMKRVRDVGTTEIAASA